MEEEKHFACLGECGGVSHESGTCQSEICSMHGKPFVECSCKMPEHVEEEHADE